MHSVSRMSHRRAGGQTLTGQTVDNLIAMIEHENYATGALLPPERDLTIRFGVSRTVIREALQVLAARGIVTIRRGTGVTVGSDTARPVLDYLALLLQRDRATVDELLELRRVLEVEMAALAAQRSTPADHRAMARTIEIMRAHPESPEGYVDADVEFHRLLIQSSHNRLFLIVLQPISDLLRASRIASFKGVTVVVERTIRDHEMILGHVVNRNVEGARAAMYLHLSHTEHDLESRASVVRTSGDIVGA